MYGVPANLDLSMFIGATLIQIAIGGYEVQFNFDGGRGVSVEGFWQVKNASGHMMEAKLARTVADLPARRDMAVGDVRAETSPGGTLIRRGSES